MTNQNSFGGFQYLQPMEAIYTGKVEQTIDFVSERQLKDKELWKKFANQFRVWLNIQ